LLANIEVFSNGIERPKQRETAPDRLENSSKRLENEQIREGILQAASDS